MTRTERSAFPRAVLRDRSESKSGLDKSIRKGGAGAHGWGHLNDAQEHEIAALDDEFTEVSSESSAELSEGSKASVSPTIEEIETAKQLRKNAFKGGDVDLSAIARSSAAVSGSPPAKSNIVRTQSN